MRPIYLSLLFFSLCIASGVAINRLSYTPPSYAETASAVAASAAIQTAIATATPDTAVQVYEAAATNTAPQTKSPPAATRPATQLPEAATTANAPVKPEPAPHTYERLFYYVDGKLAKKSFLAHAKSIDIFAPQSYGLYDTGELKGSVDPDLLAFAKKNGIRVMPLVTNDGFSRGAYQAILNDPKKQQAAIEALVAEAKKNGYWGWQIDFEQMDASYRDAFSLFVEVAGIAMRQNGLKLSVAVFAQHSENPGEYTNDLWNSAVGVYDYAALAPSVDFVSIMSYDDAVSLGPPAEWAWYKKVLTFSLSKIPAAKISFGIPLYYWLWNDTTGEKVEAGGNEGIQSVFNKRIVAVRYSAKHHVPYLEYRKNGAPYTLWYENGESVAEKIALIKRNKLYGFSAWALGLERPNIWTAVN